MKEAALLLLLQAVAAIPPSCLSSSQAVSQVNGLSVDSTLRAGFITFAEAATLARYLFYNGVVLMPHPVAWFGVGYPNGNFISIEDCTAPENKALERCAYTGRTARYTVQLVSQTILFPSPYIHAWPFDTQIVGSESSYIPLSKDSIYNVTQQPWWRVSGWSAEYLADGRTTRSYGSAQPNYTIAAAYSTSEGVCSSIADSPSRLPTPSIVGIVIAVSFTVYTALLIYRRRKRQAARQAAQRLTGNPTPASNSVGGASFSPLAPDAPPAYAQSTADVELGGSAAHYSSNHGGAGGFSAHYSGNHAPAAEHLDSDADSVHRPASNPAPKGHSSTSPGCTPSEHSFAGSSAPSESTSASSAPSGSSSTSTSVQFPESDYVEQLDGPPPLQPGVPAGLAVTLAAQPASPTPGFSENYMANLALVSTPEPVYTEPSYTSSFDTGYQAPSYDTSPPSYY